MNTDEKYMFRCIELAKQGFGEVAPNPMVGCVIVHNRKIIGEGFHKKFGEAHAEVNAINSVRNKKLLLNSTLYVNLEPCSHHGKTPPCADLIAEYKIPKVVIGCADSNKIVSGKGIKMLEKSGCAVTINILEKESRELNKRFFTFHEKKRPYIILKWAQSIDGFIGKEDKKIQISNPNPIAIGSRTILHKWRSEEQAIMVGTNTAIVDNPQLNVREWNGKNPVRVVVDKSLRLPPKLNLFDKSQPTLVFTSKKKKPEKNLEFIQIDFSKNNIHQILEELHQRNIQSLIVEGGAKLLNSFMEEVIWDEMRVFTSNKIVNDGIKAPRLSGNLISKNKIGEDDLTVLQNFAQLS